MVSLSLCPCLMPVIVAVCRLASMWSVMLASAARQYPLRFSVAFDILMSTELDKAKAELAEAKADMAGACSSGAASDAFKCCLVVFVTPVVFILVAVVLGLVFG